jgi:two-component system LytT family response regulator
LLKPITKERLSAALDRARNLLRQNASHKQNDYPKHLAVKEKDGVQLIKVNEIDWVEADGRYVILHSGSRSFAIREGINSFSSRLDPSRFLRIHRSYVVNVDRIAKLQPSFHGDYRVLLNDGTRLLLSRHYKNAVRRILGTNSL